MATPHNVSIRQHIRQHTPAYVKELCLHGDADAVLRNGIRSRQHQVYTFGRVDDFVIGLSRQLCTSCAYVSVFRFEWEDFSRMKTEQ